jgi:dynein heavy chain, axonemal
MQYIMHRIHLQESYAMLNKHEVPVAREEIERCDTLRYSWRLLQAKAVEMSSRLIELQPQYRQELVNNVVTFITDCDQFYASYNSVSYFLI